MASFSAWIKKKFNSKAESSSATPSATASAILYATTPEQFLELTRACEDRAQGMLTPNVDGSMSRLRINDRQCKYLAEKLKLAVQEAEMFLTHLRGSPILREKMTNCLDQFKLLHNVACAVETIIQNCCNDAWVAAAFLMPSTSQDVLSVIFDLALLEYFFSGNYIVEVEGVYKGEASVVTKKAENDRHLLLRNVKALLLTEKNNAEYQLAELLLKRLETSEAYRTDIKSLTEEDRLGRGSYASVYKSKWLGMVDVAVKTFYGPNSEYFESEVSIVGGLSHPNLTSMFCYAKNDRECSIVMELMDCDLSEMIRNIMRDESRKLPYPFSMIEAVNIMLEVGKGVEYLHEMRIVHRDLKAANILVKQVVNCGDGESKSILVKVADFGLSKTKEKSMTYSTQTFNKGTARWMAPEVIQIRSNDGQEEVFSDTKYLKYPYRSDVHSFGMVCYEILTGEMPYFELGSLHKVKEKILSGHHPELPEYCFPELKELIERCWSLDASKRPRFSEICAKLRTFRFQLLLADWQQRIGPQSIPTPTQPLSQRPSEGGVILRYSGSAPGKVTHRSLANAPGALQVNHVDQRPRKHLELVLEKVKKQPIIFLQEANPGNSMSRQDDEKGLACLVSTQPDVVECCLVGATPAPPLMPSTVGVDGWGCSQVAIKLHGEASIVVGLDFGTTSCGYAFAHRSKPEEILTCYDLRKSRNPFCKPLMAIYYEPGDVTTAKVKSWGFPAMHNFQEDSDNINERALRVESAVDWDEIGSYFYVIPFAQDMPGSMLRRKGFTATQVFADYLREIGASIMHHLRTKFNNDITMADVQWCVTIPRTGPWVDQEKKQMQVCMVRAGLVRSANLPHGSPHPLRFVLDAEAASCYCHRIMTDLELKFGDRLLVVDMGGEKTHIVVQEWMSETPNDFKVKNLEIFELYSGKTDVDFTFFFKTLHKGLGLKWEVYKQWMEIKCNFSDQVTIGESFKIQLSSKLAAKWKELDRKDGIPPRSSYDELELTHADIEAIFKPYVKRILDRIEYVILRKSIVKVIFVVGGFGGSPYPLTKIKERFLGTVEKVISPIQPGSAVSQGAVMLAL